MYILVMTENYFPQKPHQYIEEELKNRQLRRPGYSLRAFARDLELSPSMLSEILAQKTGVSRERALSISKKLKLSALHQEHFCDLIESQFARKESVRKEASVRAKSRVRSQNGQLALDQFRIISDWHHLAIIEMLNLGEKYHNLENLSESLRLKPQETLDALERLERVGLVEKSDSFFVATKNKTSVGENVPDAAIRKFHTQMLDLSKKSIDEFDVEQRFLQSIVFSIRQQDQEAFRQALIKTTASLVAEFYHKPDKDVAYALSLQFFPISHEVKS